MNEFCIAGIDGHLTSYGVTNTKGLVRLKRYYINQCQFLRAIFQSFAFCYNRGYGDTNCRDASITDFYVIERI